MAYSNTKDYSSNDALTLALQKLREASGLANNPKLDRLQQLKGRESITGQGQSLLNTAMRQGAKTGSMSTSGASQGTSKAMDKIMNAASETEQGIKLGQEQNRIGNLLNIAGQSSGLGSSIGSLGLGTAQLDQLIRAYNEEPSRTESERQFLLDYLNAQTEKQKELYDYTNPSFFEKLLSGILG